ncbi:unnamed protein product [Lupinus luteus]|uniref:Fatty acyl-CoA reductase n=1 Tax=Lupinus luteus TaxID=3873 RepID=A0AAV1YHA0_LUPLU
MLGSYGDNLDQVNHVFKKDLFRVVQDKWGADFGSFISNKVVAVAGDVSRDMFGVLDVKLSEEMLEDINIIVHSAASTNLDERFDVAMGTNTMGAFNVLNFAKSCRKIQIILHVSTAYVCGPRKGLVAEEPIHMGQTLNNSPRLLHINLEKQLMEEKLSELHAHNANEETITKTMKEFGMISFDDQNAEKLRIAARGVLGMNEEFNFNPKAINWKDYMMNIHFPGLVKYSIRSKM